MLKSCLATALIIALASCTSPRTQPEQYGAMRAVMREGQTEARVTVCDVAGDRSRFGIGALEGLSGEITIDAGEVWVSRVDAGKPVTTGPNCVPSDRATLLSIGSIDNPVTSTIDVALASESLENAIARAGAAEQSVQGPFMFAIDATATAVEAHVIAGSCAHADPTADALRLSINSPLEVRVIGLFAEGQPGILTHHGSNVHMHAIFVYEGERITAHVDSITLAAGARLTVPGSRAQRSSARDKLKTAESTARPQ